MVFITILYSRSLPDFSFLPCNFSLQRTSTTFPPFSPHPGTGSTGARRSTQSFVMGEAMFSPEECEGRGHQTSHFFLAKTTGLMGPSALHSRWKRTAQDTSSTTQEAIPPTIVVARQAAKTFFENRRPVFSEPHSLEPATKKRLQCRFFELPIFKRCWL